MIGAKEKAKELFDKYQIAGSQWYVDTTKKYALIAQEKTIEALKKARTYTDYGTSAWADIDNDIIFELQVKQEILEL